MTGLWLYACVVLPAMVVTLGYAAVRLNERAVERGQRGAAE